MIDYDLDQFIRKPFHYFKDLVAFDFRMAFKKIILKQDFKVQATPILGFLPSS
jgi:hypothetical protein